MWSHFSSEADWFLHGLLGLPREAENEGAVDRDAEIVAVAGEPARDVDPHPLLDIVQDLLVAGLVADEQQPQTVVTHDFQGRARHIGFGVARPGDAEPAQFAGDRLRAWAV